MPQSFDADALLEQLGDDREFLAETVQMLESDAPGMLGQIEAALNDGNTSEMGRLAHTLKGMVSNFCAAEAAAAALELEKMGKSGQMADAPAALDILRDRVRTLITELSALVKGDG